jgi:cell division septal protein FtsQ
MAKTFKKPYRIRRKKQLLKNKFFLLGVAAFLIGSGIFYLICLAPFSQIKAITISGCQKVQAGDLEKAILSQIEKNIGFLDTQSIFLADSQKITVEILKNFPQIETINFKKDLPDNLKVLVKEREPVAVLQQNDKSFFIDNGGLAYEEVLGSVWPGLIIKNQTLSSALKPGQIAVKENLLAQILKINSALTKDLKINTTGIEIASEQRLNVKTTLGFEIYFNLKGDIDWQIAELKIILENKIPSAKRRNLNYIDLRFDRVFVSPEGLISD